MAATTTHWGRRAGATELPPGDGIRLEALPVAERVIVLPSTDDLARGRPWAERLASAAVRRARRAWNTWGRRQPAAEAARDWLVRSAPVGSRAAGLAASPGRFDPCPGLTGGVLATAAAYGEHALARRLADWLAEVQQPDGAFPDAGLLQASILNTAQAVRGLLAACDVLRDPADRERLETMIIAACHYLSEAVDRGGAGTIRSDIRANHAALTELTLAAPLHLAASRWPEPGWERTVARVRRNIQRVAIGNLWQAPLHVVLPGIEALVEMGERRWARRALRPVAALQRRDGAVTALPGGTWISTTGVAHLASIWYRLDEAARADRALAWLRRRQERSGGFLGSYGRGACYYPRREVAWACKHFLDASRRQVEASFASQRANLPDRIDPADGRLQAVAGWCASFEAGDRIADVGCGRGRYLAALGSRFPALQFAGIDPAAQNLAELPADIESLRGGLPNLPLDNGACAGAMAIEALEHSLIPERGVSDLCRIVRRGGRVLVIDKNRAHQPLSACEPWERWFAPEEVSGWLAQHCRDVKCVAVPHAEHRDATGLFLCWTGTRR